MPFREMCTGRTFIYNPSQNNETNEESTLKEETFASGKIREIFGINFRELAVFAFLARINFREFMILDEFC